MERSTGPGPGAPFPPTLIYAAGFLIGWWLDARMGASPGRQMPEWVGIVGWGLVVGGVLLFIWGMTTFSKMRTGILLQKPATRVVDEPPYSWSRNPMYVSFTAMYIGLALALHAWWSLLLLPFVIAILTMAVIAREERYMRATFGSAYEDYCRRVRRWI
jgi:protein-S-isoprenylcysteine O-methyltransferase Ste14